MLPEAPVRQMAKAVTLGEISVGLWTLICQSFPDLAEMKILTGALFSTDQPPPVTRDPEGQLAVIIVLSFGNASFSSETVLLVPFEFNKQVADMVNSFAEESKLVAVMLQPLPSFFDCHT
ncbi:protein of unknown function [Brevefilum fermentans]|uniref:Uncharacterized protein n=1 Tax=Candidatus Brevifilum fermentans TaxID=1986204 RepID=A0A1Y6K8E8_9CHLR|nr:protein of unknown function [Brevefilum fermentans]